ncbi:hypothetical protein JCM10049v2_005594 [Rhodotorula toruloides]
MADSHKRPRSASGSSDSSGSLSTPPSPSNKVYRSSSPSQSQWTCTLPPTCDRTPSTFSSSSSSLEAHHRVYHAFVCTAPPSTFDFAIGKSEKKRYRYREDGRRERICGRVFPDERMLQLHLTECHDELAQLKHERGEKIFACFLPSCTQLFSTPKNRRLHLIAQHGYPSQYYFSVTVWGVEDVLKKGGGMVRREWKPRDGQECGRGSSEETVESPPSPVQERHESPPHLEPPSPPTVTSSADVDDLAAALSGTSISLVPRSVRLACKNKMQM